MKNLAWLVVFLVMMPAVGFAAKNQTVVEKPAIAAITELGPHLFDFTAPDTVAEISVFEQWTVAHATPANEHSAVSFRVRYTVQLDNVLSGSHGIVTTDFAVDPPVMTRTAKLGLPLTDIWNTQLEEGTYHAMITASVWKETPGHLQWVGEAATSTTVFYLTRVHGAFTIATPELPSVMLMPVENSADLGAEFVTYKAAGAIIPAGAVTEPMLFTLDEVDTMEHPELDFDDRAGPIFAFEPSVEFAVPVTVQIMYDPANNDRANTMEVNNRIVVQVGSGWVELPSHGDIFTDTLWAETLHFSYFSSIIPSQNVNEYFSYYGVYRQMTGTLPSRYYRANGWSALTWWSLNYLINIDACNARTKSWDALEINSFLESLSANTPEHFLDAGDSSGSRRRARIKELILYGLLQLEAETINYRLNDPYVGQAFHDPDYKVRRGWPQFNYNTKRSTCPPSTDDPPEPSTYYPGWHVQATDDGHALIGLAAGALAIQQYAIETGEGGNALFSAGEAAALAAGPYLRVMRDPEGSATCDVAVPANDCFVDFSTLTFDEVAHLLANYGRTVMQWHLDTQRNHVGQLSWFTYDSEPQETKSIDNYGNATPFHVNGVVRPNSDWIIHNQNVQLGRASFMFGRLFPEAQYYDPGRLAMVPYRQAAFDAQSALATSQFSCRDSDGQSFTCHTNGILGEYLWNQSRPPQYPWLVGSYVNDPIMNLEDPGHIYATQSLTGLLNGKSLYNTQSYFAGSSIRDRLNRQFSRVYRTYWPAWSPQAYGCVLTSGFFTDFQCMQ